MTDAEIDVFNLQRNEFSEINVTLCMSDKACIGLCRDKMELYRYLEKQYGGNRYSHAAPGGRGPG